MSDTDTPDEQTERRGGQGRLKEFRGRAVEHPRTARRKRSAIGELLYKARHEKDLARHVVAERAGVAELTIARYETGAGRPRLETALAIAPEIGLSAEDVQAAYFEDAQS